MSARRWLAALPRVVHAPLRASLGGLWLAGAGLAAFSAVRGAGRLGPGSVFTFAVVAVALGVLAVMTLRAARWAVVVSTVAAGSQVVGALGAAWELFHPVESPKTRELRLLGVDPRLAFAINAGYSSAAAALFVWIALRARRGRAG